MSIKLVTKSIWGNPGNRGRRLRKSLDAAVWQLRKRTIRSPRTVRLPNGVLFRAYPDCVVSSALIYADWPEYHELMFLRGALRSGDVIIDIGANVGHISLLLADIVGPSNIIAFEPTPVSFQRLVGNWRLNGWATDGLFQKAIGSNAGTVFVPDVDRPVTTNKVTSAPLPEPFVEVPLVRLDDLSHLWESRSIGLLKIDVEGYEREVFIGSRRLLEKHRPGLIMFESLSWSLDRRVGSLLASCEYVVFQLDLQGHPDFSGDSGQNLFAIPKEYRYRFER